MSLNINPLSVVQTLEPRTRVYNERQYAIFRGGKQSSWKPVVSTSFSDTSIQFTAPPPNPQIIVDRKVKLNTHLLVTLTGNTGTANNLYNPANNNDAPRSHPLQRIINTMAVTLNNTQVSNNNSDVVDPIFYYGDDDKKREIDNSLSPAMLDQSQQYSDLNGGVRNPLNNYASSVSGADTGRGAFNFTVLTNTPTSATILLNVTDYLYLSPFLSNQMDGPGFVQLQTMDFNISLGNLSRCWSTFNPFVTSVSATLSNQLPPQLLFNYITPDTLMKLPKSVCYPYFEIQRYPTNMGSVNAGVTISQVQSNNIQLHSIPNRIYLFARRRNADRTAFTTDTFAGINSISVNWNNQSGLLSSAKQEDLYALSMDNGLQMSWTQFSRNVGSMICLVMGKDICLEPNECPGMLGTYQLQINCSVTNLASSAINLDLYVITVSEGTLTLEDNRAITQIGVVSQSDVLNSVNAPMIPYEQLVDQRGASFWSSIKDFFGDVGRGVKKAYDTVAPIVREVAPYVGPARALLGVGANSGGSVSGGGVYSDFLKAHKGQLSGVSQAERAKMYKKWKKDNGIQTAPKKKKVGKCKPGKVKKSVSRCVAKKNKGGVLYEGGQLIDRNMMASMLGGNLEENEEEETEDDEEYKDEQYAEESDSDEESQE